MPNMHYGTKGYRTKLNDYWPRLRPLSGPAHKDIETIN